ncbi:hypothetical protein ACIQMJ_12810 [Actinosynnema sp. NPDC091369]
MGTRDDRTTDPAAHAPARLRGARRRPPDGSLLGTARSHQEGTASPDRFSTTGEAYVDQPDGTTAGPYPASMTGTPTRR